MKSFKKIALVSAAALTFSTFLTSIANAAPLAVTVNGVTNATSATSPATANVPADNTVDTGDAVTIAATADTGTSVTFTASAGVKLSTALSNSAIPVNANGGVGTLTLTAQGSALVVYAFTTSTSVGNVVVTNGSYSTVVYLKGVASTAYNVGVTVPASAAIGTTIPVSVNVTDVFGNPVAGSTVSVTVIGATFDDLTVNKNLVTDATTDATTGTILGSKSAKITVGTAGVVTLAISGGAANTITGFAAPVRATTSSIIVSDLNTTVSTLNAQILSLTSKVDSLTAQVASLTKQLSDAKGQLAMATAAQGLSDLNASSAKSAQKTVEDKYAALLAKYNVLAKKFKQPTIK